MFPHLSPNLQKKRLCDVEADVVMTLEQFGHPNPLARDLPWHGDLGRRSPAKVTASVATREEGDVATTGFLLTLPLPETSVNRLPVPVPTRDWSNETN